MTVLEGSANDISQRLQNREIDVALLETRRVETTWDSVLLGTDAMVLCMNEQHPLVGLTRSAPVTGRGHGGV